MLVLWTFLILSSWVHATEPVTPAPWPTQAFSKSIVNIDELFEKKFKLKALSCTYKNKKYQGLQACLLQTAYDSTKSTQKVTTTTALFQLSNGQNLNLLISWRPASWGTWTTIYQWVWSWTKDQVLRSKVPQILGLYFGEITIELPESENLGEIFNKFVPQVFESQGFTLKKLKIVFSAKEKKNIADVILYNETQAAYSLHFESDIDIFRVLDGFSLESSNWRSLLPEEP